MGTAEGAAQEKCMATIAFQCGTACRGDLGAARVAQQLHSIGTNVPVPGRLLGWRACVTWARGR
jgi:hypothetical protein